MSWTMYRVDVENGTIEPRSVIHQSAKVVHFLNPIHSRKDSEKKVASTHSWHASEKTALDWLIRNKAEQLKTIIKLEEKTRSELGKLRREYRKKYEREHPVCSRAPDSPLCASHCLR